MRKKIAIATAAFLIIGLTSGISWAGDARRHTIEGFILGTGVTLLGTAIVHNLSKPAPAWGPPPPVRHPLPRGHWESRKVWMPPVYDTRWIPGHYNHHGRWVGGRHDKVVVAGGFWDNRQVWVDHRRHR